MKSEGAAGPVLLVATVVVPPRLTLSRLNDTGDGVPSGLLLRTAMAWASIGALVGMGVAVAAGRLMSSLLFSLAPTDPATILVATAALLLVAALAGYWPARRASRLNPVTALRHE